MEYTKFTNSAKPEMGKDGDIYYIQKIGNKDVVIWKKTQRS